MAKFIKFMDWDGDESFLNLDLVKEIKVEKSKGSDDPMIHVSYENSDVNIPYVKNEDIFRALAEEPETATISRNLFHIWEILRARLH